MLIYRSLSQLSRVKRPLVLAAGAFDGVHRGHQHVIEAAMREARGLRGETWVLTFDPHPLRILKPELAPAMLTSKDHKLKLLHGLGINGCLVLPFTKKLAGVEPEEFIAQLKKNSPKLKQLVVGENWTFGRRARGNVKMLKTLSRRHGFAVTIARPLKFEGESISSTRIRDNVAAGRLDDAHRMLGRQFSIRGDVIHGKKLGRKLGFPTANVDPHNEVRPPAGIYAAHAFVRGQSYPAAVYLNASARIVEAHLIDCQLDLYGQEIEIVFEKRIRPDRKFASLTALKRQIARDIAAAKKILLTDYSD